MEQRKTEAPKPLPRMTGVRQIVEDMVAARGADRNASRYRGGNAASNELVRSLGLTPITGRTGPKISY